MSFVKINSIKVGSLRTNCYILSEGEEALVIDPGFEVEKILKETAGKKIKAVVLTHGHYDHVTSAFDLNAPVWIGEKDEPMMLRSTGKKAARLLKENDSFDICHLTFVIINTPGHTPGGICLHNKKEGHLPIEWVKKRTGQQIIVER